MTSILARSRVTVGSHRSRRSDLANGWQIRQIASAEFFGPRWFWLLPWRAAPRLS